jgi:hypothetical protein
VPFAHIRREAAQKIPILGSRAESAAKVFRKFGIFGLSRMKNCVAFMSGKSWVAAGGSPSSSSNFLPGTPMTLMAIPRASCVLSGCGYSLPLENLIHDAGRG